MKKLLGLAFVAIFMMSMASTKQIKQSSEERYACFEWADTMATYVGFKNGLTHEEEYNAFVYYYDTCMNQ